MSEGKKEPDKYLCDVSERKISLKDNLQVFKYIVAVLFVCGEKSKNLSKKGQYVDKKRCKEAIEKILIDPEYVYDNRETLYLFKKLDNNIQETISDQNGDLKISITFDSTFDKENIGEMRTFLNTIFNQYPVNENRYSFVGKGEIYEVANEDSEEAKLYQKYGLVIRHGNSKGVQFINNNTEAKIAMDYKKSIFYTGNANFLELVKTCLKTGLTYDQITELYKNVVLQVKHRPWEYFEFRCFTEEIVGNLEVENQTMVEYFRLKYKTDINATTYKAVQRDSKCSFPLDTLVVVPDQKVSKEKLLKFGMDQKTKKPSVSERYEAIKNQYEKMEFNNHITAAFGIEVSPTMIKAKYEQLQMPSIIAGNNGKIIPEDDGSFRIDKDWKAASISNLYIFGCPGYWKKFLDKNLRKMNIQFKKIITMEVPSDIFNFQLWKNKFANIIPSTDYVIVITETQEIHELLEFLKIKTGIRIQHILKKTTEKKCIHNIIQKLNVKADGFNWKIDYKSENLNLNSTTRHKIVIAVDVCRPFCKNNARNLIDKAACVGMASNSEKNPFGFKTTIFYQKAGQEIIFKSEEPESDLFFKKLTTIFEGFSREKGADIIYIRDGVSETQYKDVIDQEIPIIQKAAEDYFGKSKFKILGLIATKSGNTRFFDTSHKGDVKNLPPRTVIALGNRDIYEQFHIIPHFVRAGQGTSKGLMATIIMNEIGAEMQEIQNFLLALCNLHQSNCGPISLPAPIFLADKVAYKGQRMLAAYEKLIPKNEQIKFNGMNYKELTTAITKRINDNDLPQQQ